MTFVCPRCHGRLAAEHEAYGCAACELVFPIVCGIPDFRLQSDPYIGLDDDRRKAERLFAQGTGLTFPDLLRHYYAITPEDPSDLASRWIARSMAEPEIAGALLAEHGLVSAPHAPDAALLDVGCSTGGLLIAAHGSYGSLVGVDVALRWLAVGRIRLRDAGVEAALVCANAEHLPFPAAAFSAVTCIDTLEHVREAAAALGELRRVGQQQTALLATANNRWAPLPEPNIHLWGVPQLPRRWQAAYVRWRRGDLHPYQIHLFSARELASRAADAGFENVSVTAGSVAAPHATAAVRRVVDLYNAGRRAPVIASLLRLFGPKLVLTAGATVLHRPSP